ncbi:DUF935 domain-containing protein [Thiothrix lacustris]|uniref:DUF935 domain-containing protein n=1 Tax=Thiothrix lacustris TaxID=525917 RepID=UPI00146FB791|nr:DUF935 domain-containing protein [Thiothrix lacustris]
MSRLLGNKKQPPPKGDQTAALSYLPKEFADHPGKNLTPAKAMTLLLEAEQGNLRALADLADDMEERDTHLYAELMKRRRGCLTADWSLSLRNADKSEQKALEQLTEQLKNMPMPDIIWDMTDAIHKGYACAEIQWEYADKAWLPATIQHRPANWFTAMPEDRDTLMLRTQEGKGVALQDYSWITHTHKARSGYLTNTALARVTVWPFLFRAFSSRDFAEFLEIYGLPLRLGRYPSGATAEERSTLLRAVTAIGHSAAGILPANMAIEFQRAAEGQADPYMAMVGWAEGGISKAILGGTLTSDSGKNGNYATASVHDDARKEIRKSDLRQIGKTLSSNLIKPLCLFNTTLTRVPQFIFDDTEPEDNERSIYALVKLAEAMPIPLEWVRNKFKIPAPNGDEPILQITQPTAGSTAAAKATHHSGCSCCNSEATAALKGSDGQDSVQGDIDSSTPTDDALRSQAQALIQPLIDKALEGVRAGDPAETILTTLMMGYPEMDSSKLSDALTKASFIADLMGRWEAQQDIGNGKA